MNSATPLPAATDAAAADNATAAIAATAASASDASAAPGAADPAAPAAECAEQLRQRFPALFVGAVKPLKLRIQADIRERAPGVFSKAELSGFLRRHTGRTGYLIALTRATQRFDLDGVPAGEVTAEHRQAALDELARRRDLRESREAQLEQQRRNRAELLRAYQGTALSAANFCALKGVAPDQLDGMLELARREAEARAQAAAPPGRDGAHPHARIGERARAGERVREAEPQRERERERGRGQPGPNPRNPRSR